MNQRHQLVLVMVMLLWSTLSSRAQMTDCYGTLKIRNNNVIELGAGISGKQTDAGKIGYQKFTPDALDIVGAGTLGTNRKIKFWNEGGATFTGKITAPTLQLTSGAAAGKILTSDATGNATWQTPSSNSPVTSISFTAPLGDYSPTITARTIPAGQGAANERTELILFHSNDPQNGAGEDLITLRAPALRFQTYNNANVADINNNAGSNDRMYINSVGNVGIGTTNPVQKLHVEGNIQLSGFLRYGGANDNFTHNGQTIPHYGLGWTPSEIGLGAQFKLASYEAINLFTAGALRMKIDHTGLTTFNGNLVTPAIRVETNISAGGSGYFQIDAPGIIGGRMSVLPDGKITMGSGLSTPAGYRLYVADGILTEKVKVALKNTANWADYVFSKDYRFMSLQELEKFIQQNHHLPGIPSAQQIVNEGGIDVVDMSSKILEKTEENTLYIIELNKVITDIQQKVEVLMQKVEQLEDENASLKKNQVKKQ